jgi:X-X-X-Leu-X-X-Gly heptad repeat protein
MKKILSIILSAALLFALTVSVSAADTSPSSPEKEEVVYGLLDLNGGVDDIYVVNIFDGGEITDYGDYTQISNLTTSEKISQSGDEITISTAADKLYYQGTLASWDLPWAITITYTLDGQEISGEELAGKSGALQISLTVTQNDRVSSTFFENYALQITFGLPTELCDNITAENATVAEAGGEKQLSFTVLPGDGADILITADVHDFEMDAVTINGIKLALDINIDQNAFSEEITQLADAIGELDDGAGDLLDGVQQLASGMAQYLDGLEALKDGLSAFDSGVGELADGASSLSDGLSSLSEQGDALVSGALAIQQSTFDSVNSQLDAMGLGLPVLTPENYSSVLADIPDLAEVKAQLDGVVQFTAGLQSYTSGVSQLGTGASDLADGMAQLQSSTTTAAEASSELYSAGAELNAAITKLRDGLASYKDGTGELRDETSDMDSEIADKIAEMLDSISGNGDPWCPLSRIKTQMCPPSSLS